MKRNLWQGWWKSVTRTGYVSWLSPPFRTDIAWFIDTSTSPYRLFPYTGNQCRLYPPNVHTGIVPPEDQFINLFPDDNDPNVLIINPQTPEGITLNVFSEGIGTSQSLVLKDGKIYANFYHEQPVNGTYLPGQIMKRISDKKVEKLFKPVTNTSLDPQAQFIQYSNYHLLSGQLHLNKNVKDPKCLPVTPTFEEAKDFRDKLLNSSVCYKTKINRILQTNHNIWLNPDIDHTVFYTKEFHYINEFTYVVFKGFSGNWEFLNGQKFPTVALNYMHNILPPKGHIVQDPERWYRFTIELDSSGIPSPLPEELGYVKVKYGPITPDARETQYREFMGTMFHYINFLAGYSGMTIHTNLAGYQATSPFFGDVTVPGKILNTWEELQDLQGGLTLEQFLSEISPLRQNSRTLNWFPYSIHYPPLLIDASFLTLFVPNGWTNEVPDGFFVDPAEPKFNFNLVVNNYLEKPKNIYYTITGEPDPEVPLQSRLTEGFPVVAGEFEIGPGEYPANGSRMDFILADYGYPLDPGAPSPAQYRIATDQFSFFAGAFDENGNVLDPPFGAPFPGVENGFYIGIVKRPPNYNGSRKVGYMWLGGTNIVDSGSLVDGTLLAPRTKAGASYNHMKMFTVIFQFFRDEGVTDFIIDAMGNQGGLQAVMLALAAMFGKERSGYGYDAECVSPDSEILDPRDFAAADKSAKKDFNNFNKTINPNLYKELFNFKPYSDCTVVFLNSRSAISQGDAFPHVMANGVNGGRDLGKNVDVRFVGETFGLWSGILQLNRRDEINAIIDSEPFPVLVDGNPGLQFEYTTDISSVFFTLKKDKCDCGKSDCERDCGKRGKCDCSKCNKSDRDNCDRDRDCGKRGKRDCGKCDRECDCGKSDRERDRGKCVDDERKKYASAYNKNLKMRPRKYIGDRVMYNDVPNFHLYNLGIKPWDESPNGPAPPIYASKDIPNFDDNSTWRHQIIEWSVQGIINNERQKCKK